MLTMAVSKGICKMVHGTGALMSGAPLCRIRGNHHFKFRRSFVVFKRQLHNFKHKF
jgi:hypothetical protein